ncbi:hypothetical protein [uncultured Croceitalea sp.]|uniref:hypothetical protein n=1 Tax=uncultured Croceitalea sp. TaxID=1798908 RepID=UPI00330562DD
METIVKTDQKIQLVDGSFTPSEAADVILALLDEKINFHKLQRISWCEGHADANTQYPDDRIKELENEKRITKEFIASVRNQNKRLRINGVLEISLEE